MIAGVCLNVTDMELASRYYAKLGLLADPMRMGEFTFKGYPNFRLVLCQVDSIDRGEAFGRLAISCADDDIEKVFKESGS